MFFGAGGIFFNKPLADYNFCNDIDDDVFNLYMVLQNQKDILVANIEILPMSESLLKHWSKNKEIDPIKKAVRFLMLSNFIVNGNGSTLRFGQRSGNEKKAILSTIEQTFQKIRNAKFMCQDFRKVISKISFIGIEKEKRQTFIYADPPYIDTGNNYSQGFTENDTIDLFDVCVKSNVPFAISEFDHPSVLELAKHHNLEVITIGERQNLKNRRTEILVVNYESPALYSLFRNQEQNLLLV
jgi:DNA adenine methylase